MDASVICEKLSGKTKNPRKDAAILVQKIFWNSLSCCGGETKSPYFDVNSDSLALASETHHSSALRAPKGCSTDLLRQ